MADLIDRQAALKELTVYIHLIDKVLGKGIMTNDDCTEAAKSVLGEDELPAAQPETHWIPCSERLPEEQRYCLTSCRNGLVCEDFHWSNGYFDKADKYHHEVIAWMPLPEPYRGGEE